MIGIMLQSGNLFDHLSIEDNILLQMQLAGQEGVTVSPEFRARDGGIVPRAPFFTFADLRGGSGEGRACGGRFDRAGSLAGR